MAPAARTRASPAGHAADSYAGRPLFFSPRHCGDTGREAGGVPVLGEAESMGPGPGRDLCTLEGHSADVLGVAVTPDGKRAVSASHDETLRVWDMDTGRDLRTLQGHYWRKNPRIAE
jgi:WD40 repeat protein